MQLDHPGETTLSTVQTLPNRFFLHLNHQLSSRDLLKTTSLKLNVINLLSGEEEKYN